MSLLFWDTPKRARSSKDHAAAYGADGAPPGVYVPNMSDADAERWKAKITGQKRGILQVEIRKRFGVTQLTLIVCLNGGYVYKNYAPSEPGVWRGYTTDNVNIHMAMNGPLQLSFGDLAEIQTAVEEARTRLRELEAA